MAYRWCETCEEWLETSEYTVNEEGETVCPEHSAVIGFIPGTVVREKPTFNQCRFPTDEAMRQAVKRKLVA